MAEGGARMPLASAKHHQQPVPSAASGVIPQAPVSAPLPPPLPAPLITPLTHNPTLRQLVLRRPEGHGFGFTLRHLIVYPPETYSELCSDVRHAMVGAVNEPMDSIFVRSIHPSGAGARAGLRPGDRILAVDNLPVAGWPYAKVVHYIQQAPSTLMLHVVPKEADVLQKYFSEAAHNPETNQRSGSNTREKRISSGNMPVVRDAVGAIPPGPTHQLYTPSAQLHYRPINPNNIKQVPQQMSLEVQQRLMIEHRKTDSRHPPGMIAIPSMSDPRTQHTIRADISDRIYSTPEGNDSRMVRAVDTRPQALMQQDLKSSRRASDGTRSPIDNYSYYVSPPSSPFNSSKDSSSIYNSGESLPSSYRNQLPFTKSALITHMAAQPQPLNNKVLVQSTGNLDNVPVQYYNNKLQLDDRRESNTSLTSSAADSKDSLSFYDSNSTLTGHETDDSLMRMRIRKSLEQKEEFLRRPSQPTGWVTPEDPVIVQKEFYSRPQKLNKPVWPPTASSEQMQSKNKENIQDNSNSVVMNHVVNKESSDPSDKNESSVVSVKSKQDKCYVSTLTKIHENSSSNDSSGGTLTNGSPASPTSLETMLQDKRYPVPSEVQIVSNRTKQFESPQPEDRTELYKSELARLSTKKPEPTVAIRRKEFESRGGKRDAKSLEAQYSLEDQMTLSDGNVPSGNRITITGGKHLTCPPPEDYHPENEKVRVRLRSNSTGSEGLPTRRNHAADGSYVKRRYALNKEQIEELSGGEKINDNIGDNRVKDLVKNDSNGDSQNLNGFTNAISKSTSYKRVDEKLKDNVMLNNNDNVQMIQKLDVNNRKDKSPAISMELDVAFLKKPERPTQLNLSPGGFSLSHSPPTTPSSPHSLAPSPSGFSIDDGLVTRRQKNSMQLGAEEEKAMRRVSYLKATWGDRLHIDSDHELSDGEIQTYRSEKKDHDEFRDIGVTIPEDGETPVNIAIQGSVQIKMVLTNGKRASDRSWKQVWAVLQGPKLLLYRNQHQSPTQGGSCESLNLRFSMADVAGDYTKRKHVVRVTSIAGAELLLQAGNAAEAARWLQALKAQTPNATQIAEPQQPIEIVSDASGVSPPSRNRKQTRTISPTENNTSSLTASPKSKTWKGRVARQLRKMQPGIGPLGGHSPTSSPNYSSVTPGVGIPLERCQGMLERPLVPQLVGICTKVVEERGLHVVGVYRVPGNTASVTALKESLEKGIPPDLQDPRWNDVNVVSSLLKAFFRSLPNPLLTKELYPMFISADKLPDTTTRVRTIRRLVRGLPDHHYDTLKFLIQHLKKVVMESAINKMETRNLAIVFGPTLVRSADDNMLTMVNDMSSQCRIIESLINYMEWYFDEEDRTSPITETICEEELPSTTTNQALLIQNVKKIEGISTKDIVSSIISAANRKIQRKPRMKAISHIESSSPVHLKGDEVDSNKPSTQLPSPTEQPQQQRLSSGATVQLSNQPLIDDNYPIKTYTGLDQTTQERVKRFEMETRAVLRREKRRDQSSNDWQNHSRQDASSPSLTSQSHISGSESEDLVSKSYYSKSNNNTDTSGKRLKTETNVSAESFSDGIIDMVSSLTSTFDQKLRSLHNSSPDDEASIPYVDEIHEDEEQDFGNPSLHRTSDILASQELLKSTNEDDDYKNESDCTQDEESLKLSSDRNSFENASINKSERKLSSDSENSSPSLKITVDESLPSNVEASKQILNNEVHQESLSYYNNFSDGKVYDYQKNKNDLKKETKTTLQEIFFKKGNNLNSEQVDSLGLLIKNKLKRSESLNRDRYISKNNNTIILSENNINSKNDASDSGIETEKSNSPKLRRSVSLNRSDVKLKRVESLTKSEKTESNLIKRREICHGNYKPTTKLKRKNGMPERSIKRRHTVGGTKDFDKDEWVALECSRTSSPDLPTSLLDKHLHSQLTAQRLPLESHV